MQNVGNKFGGWKSAWVSAYTGCDQSYGELKRCAEDGENES